MADRVSRKHMGKRFRLSSEVRATLQRKHDRWTPYRAYSRVEKEVGVFRAICQIILSFFRMPPKTEEGEVGCNGRAVKMFADLIKRSFRDDDFVSRKCTTVNVVRFFYYRIIRLLLMVRFVNDFFCLLFFLCYHRLYTGYRPTVSRGKEKAGVGGNSARFARGERVGDKGLPGAGDNVYKHVKHKSGCNGLGIAISIK